MSSKHQEIMQSKIFLRPEGFTDNSPRSLITPTPANKPSAIKTLCIFTNILDVKNRTAIL